MSRALKGLNIRPAGVDFGHGFFVLAGLSSDSPTKWRWVKPMEPSWGRCPTHFSLFWWGLGCSLGVRDFDPWSHGQFSMVSGQGKVPSESIMPVPCSWARIPTHACARCVLHGATRFNLGFPQGLLGKTKTCMLAVSRCCSSSSAYLHLHVDVGFINLPHLPSFSKRDKRTLPIDQPGLSILGFYWLGPRNHQSQTRMRQTCSELRGIPRQPPRRWVLYTAASQAEAWQNLAEFDRGVPSKSRKSGDLPRCV